MCAEIVLVHTPHATKYGQHVYLWMRNPFDDDFGKLKTKCAKRTDVISLNYTKL